MGSVTLRFKPKISKSLKVGLKFKFKMLKFMVLLEFKVALECESCRFKPRKSKSLKEALKFMTWLELKMASNVNLVDSSRECQKA